VLDRSGGYCRYPEDEVDEELVTRLEAWAREAVIGWVGSSLEVAARARRGRHKARPVRRRGCWRESWGACEAGPAQGTARTMLSRPGAGPARGTACTKVGAGA